ncbi:probable palmitoyltransferase ZDHHC24 [Parasteatoda tepidariorum]|uniref:probable palmitoyltransferase ZDHHC24 n=1 Tax=Parasteatoda tepidariorum TaxID=114398 RepID=UPI00077F994D|nr:probable palmitoyltransferase ZDHHC24 [Parasteatoda tepidariorum]
MFGKSRSLLARYTFLFSDTFSFSFLLTSVISMFIFEVFIVLPSLEEGILPTFFHVTLGTFIFINILSNLAFIMWTDSTTRKIISPAVLKPGWLFCAGCEANSPVRSFHCSKCNVCTLKRDHHCAFSKCCIGLKNFRFYLLFLFYLAIGALYAASFNMHFIWDFLGGFSVFSLAAHILPFIFFVFGYLSFRVFIYTLLSVLSVVGFLFVFGLLLIHTRQMLQNQTSFEKNQGINLYDLGWRKNIVESLGIKWYLTWVFPLLKSDLPSDGISYPTNEKSNGVSEVINSNKNVRLRHL